MPKSIVCILEPVKSSLTAANEASPGVDCRPANGSLWAGNIRRVFGGIFEMPCAECRRPFWPSTPGLGTYGLAVTRRGRAAPGAPRSPPAAAISGAVVPLVPRKRPRGGRLHLRWAGACREGASGSGGGPEG
eukprot:1193968-Prorocentrum_minimum.AAC.6